MSELPYLINDLALILIVAGIVTILFKKLKQPLVLGYVVAGFLVSPHMPYIMSVADRADIHTWADIGVMFLLFSFKKILKMGASPVIATCAIVFCMMMLGIGVGNTFGWSHMDCIFLGGMLAMSSTTIIYKAFDDLGLRQQRFAGMVMSVLILEDMLAIVMMVMLSAIAGGNSPDGRKVKGTIHWVSAADSVKAEIRLYENIIDEEKGVYNEDGSLNLNPNSLTVLKECRIEPSVKDAKPYDSFQFVRQGFFCVDCRDSGPENLVFNRIVSLKSSYVLPKKEN